MWHRQMMKFSESPNRLYVLSAFELVSHRTGLAGRKGGRASIPGRGNCFHGMWDTKEAGDMEITPESRTGCI